VVIFDSEFRHHVCLDLRLALLAISVLPIALALVWFMEIFEVSLSESTYLLQV
jgi:hypothetical protein